MGLYEDLKVIEPFSLSAHTDADGVYSATILKRLFNVKEVKFPEFGFYTTDVAVDLGSPEDKNWTGIAIDHHPDHTEDRKYKLYWDHCPTGLVLYNQLKDHIKSEDSWLVVGSLTGDGQPSLTPDEIWDKFPELLSGRGVLFKNQWGKLGTSQTLLYKFLSSGINSLCRLGRPEQAIRVLEDIDSPIQLLENAEVIDAIDMMRKEKEALFDKRSCKPPVVETLGNYSLIRVKTSRPEIKLAGVLATELSFTDNNTTFIVINEADGSGSVRGDLAKRLANKLTKAGYKAGGHGGYCGIKVSLMDIDNLIDAIRKATKE